MKLHQRIRAGAVMLCALALLTFAGCATASRVPLNGADKQITSAQVCVSQRKQEIGTDIRNSNVSAAMGGGLIGALIDAGIENSRAKSAEENVVPVRNALVGYDVGKTFSDLLRGELSKESWLQNAVIEPRQIATPGALSTLIKTATTDVVLVIATDYRMSSEFDGMTVRACVWLHPHASALNAKATAMNDGPPVLYCNELSVMLPLPPPPAGADKPSAEEAVKIWAADNGKYARQCLDNGLAELAKMLTYDLRQPGTVDRAIYTAPNGKATRAVWLTMGAGTTPSLLVNGYVEHTEGANVWLRMPGGHLVSTPK